MKRNLFIAALALLTTMGAGVAQAQYRDCDRVAADIIGIRLGNNLSITARLNDRRAFDDDRFWCNEIHRRYGVQEVVLLERRRSGLSWLDILSDVLWASSHRNDRYDRRTVVYYPQYTTRYVNVGDRGRDWDDRRWNDRDRDNRRWNDRDRDDRWRNDRDHDNRWNDRDRDRNRDEHHAWNDKDRNDRDRNDRDRNDRDRNDRNRNDRNNDRNRNNQGRNDRNDNHSRDRNIGNIRG